MMELVTRNYWWLGVIKDVRKYIDGCKLCQKLKSKIKASVGKLIANKISEKLQTHLIVVFITKLLLVAEKDTILVVYNRLSKIIYFVAITEETLAKKLARLF